MKEKIQAFAQKVEQEQIARMAEQGFSQIVIDTSTKVTVKDGKKFTKVDIGNSGRYMVDNETGNIFGIKAYGVVHRGHFYGTVDTINEYNWGDYYPLKLDGSQRPGRRSCPALTFAPQPVATV